MFQVHKRLGNAHLSMLNFSWATDLDPKGANNHIKEAIDRRYITDEDEDPSLDTSVCKSIQAHFSTHINKFIAFTSMTEFLDSHK